jgi:hypothetical protein
MERNPTESWPVERAMGIDEALMEAALSDPLLHNQPIPWKQIGARYPVWLKQWILRHLPDVAKMVASRRTPFTEFQEIDRATTGVVGTVAAAVIELLAAVGRWDDVGQVLEAFPAVEWVNLVFDWTHATAVAHWVRRGLKFEPQNDAGHLAVALAGLPLSADARRRLERTYDQWMPSLPDARPAIETVRRGDEPRAGVSLFEVDNDSDLPKTLLFVGPESFKVVVLGRGRAGIELASGHYRVAALSDGRLSYGSLAFNGAHHAGKCREQHPITRPLR